MPIRISNLRLNLDEPESALPGHLARVLGVPAAALGRWRILRKSLDARIKGSLHFVYTTEIVPPEGEERMLALGRRLRGDLRVERYAEQEFRLPVRGTVPIEERPIVVGSGPAGLVAGYFLAQQGYRPLILERGRAVRERIHDVHAFDGGGPFNPESN